MKCSAQMASLRALSALGLPAELFIPAALEMMHGIIPSLRNLFDWTDAQGDLIRYYFEGPIDPRIAAHYFEGVPQPARRRRDADLPPGGHGALGDPQCAGTRERRLLRVGAVQRDLAAAGPHTRLEAVVRNAGGRPLGSLVLYRGPGERSFSREDEVLLEQASRYVARGLEVPSAGLVAGEFVERRDRRAVLSLDAEGRLCHLSPDALKMLLLSHGDVTPDNVGRTHRREDFLTLSLLWQHHRRPGAPGHDGLVITVENAWGRFVYESTPMAPLGEGAAPMLHVGIRQQEPCGLGLRRALSTRRCRLRSARSARCCTSAAARPTSRPRCRSRRRP